MMTRSFSDLFTVVMGEISFLVVRCSSERLRVLALKGLGTEGSNDPNQPLSAQAQTAQPALRGS
jgi:hypothetical protein